MNNVFRVIHKFSLNGKVTYETLYKGTKPKEIVSMARAYSTVYHEEIRDNIIFELNGNYTNLKEIEKTFHVKQRTKKALAVEPEPPKAYT